ncbi:MAG: hypothetical protein J6X06_05480 [Elusimicrobiaceae bacterium]|nr:hypothetical protein [Elusimicrobiaceae bacterium]
MKNNPGIVMRLYRVERWFYEHRLYLLAKIVCYLIRILFACAIPPTTILKDGVKMPHGMGIVLHQNSVIGERTIIYQNVTVGNAGGPRIGSDCILGAGCVILGDIKLGNNCKIGANAVVLKDIPENCTAVGVPARIIENKDNL